MFITRNKKTKTGLSALKNVFGMVIHAVLNINNQLYWSYFLKIKSSPHNSIFDIGFKFKFIVPLFLLFQITT